MTWKFYSFCTHNTVRSSQHTVLKMKFHTRMTPGGLRSALCFYGNFIFFPRVEVHPGKKNWRTQKSTFVWTSGKSTTDCADRFSRRAHNRSIAQSVCPTMSFWHSDSQKLRLRSFSLPEALYGGNAIYRQCLYMLVEKKVHARVYIPCPRTTQR